MKANDKVSDESIAQALGIERTKRRTLRKLIKLLRAASDEILARVATEEITDYQARRINQLVAGIREILRSVYIQAGSEFEKELEEIVRLEIGRSTKVLDKAVGISWSAAPSANRAYTAAYARPFQGKLLKERWRLLPNNVSQRIEAQLRQGYVQSETQNQIAARVRKVLRGTQENWVRAEVNTAIAHFQAFAHRRTFERNRDAIKALKLTATLDNKTSPICQERDNRVYDLDKAPNLPFHMNERSIYVAVLKDAASQRFAHLLDKETRASLDGQEPAGTNFKDWIGRQSRGRQVKTLGVGRTRMIREGGLPVDSLYGNSRLLTLAEIKKKYPSEAAKAFDNG